MLRYKDVTEDGVSIEQITTRPSLYFDQWMWCLLSEQNRLRKKLVEVGARLKATIMYSFATLLELALIEDQEQIEAITEVMESFDYGFSDADPSMVIRREQELEVPEGSAFYNLNPCCDVELIKNYFLNVMDPLKPFQIWPILTKLKEEGKSGTYKTIRQRFGENLTPIVMKARQDPAALARAKERHSKKQLQRNKPPYTQDIYKLALDFAVVNEDMKMTPTEWIDLLHTVVPVAYFDFVLLDKRWCHYIRTVFPLTYPDIAQVFSQRGLDDFFSALSDFKEEEARGTSANA
jgi:hypothetical protein